MLSRNWKKNRFCDFRSQKIIISAQSGLNFWKTCLDSKKNDLTTLYLRCLLTSGQNPPPPPGSFRVNLSMFWWPKFWNSHFFFSQPRATDLAVITMRIREFQCFLTLHRPRICEWMSSDCNLGTICILWKRTGWV